MCYDYVHTKVIDSGLAKIFYGTNSHFVKLLNRKTLTKQEFNIIEKY